jgi:hypothetical protein
MGLNRALVPQSVNMSKFNLAGLVDANHIFLNISATEHLSEMKQVWKCSLFRAASDEHSFKHEK